MRSLLQRPKQFYSKKFGEHEDAVASVLWHLLTQICSRNGVTHWFAVQLLTSLKDFVVLVRNDYSSAEREEFSLTEYVNPDESSNGTLLRGGGIIGATSNGIILEGKQRSIAEFVKQDL